MYVIQVTPLIRGTKLESLSYFSAIQYEIGSFISAPVRKKNQPVIVTNCKPVSASKTSVKSAGFSLRKLPVQKDIVIVPKSLRDTAAALAKVYPVSPGAILYHLLPPEIRNGTRTYPNVVAYNHSEETTPHLLTARIDERFLNYQSHIRGVFARRGSTLFVVPTTSDITHAARELSLGIDERVVTLNSADSKKKRDEAYEQLRDTSQPKLIITTAAHAYIDRSDIKAIIVEQSASQHFTTRTRPYLDHRTALVAYAKVTGRSITLGDTVPRTEDEVRRRQDKYLTYGEEVKRIVFPAPLSVVQQKDKPQPEKETPFELFSPRLRKTIELTIESSGRAFFYAARKGLAPVVACVDCGFIFRCPDSNTPYSLVRTCKNGVETRWFVSSTSGRRIKAADTCEHCGSWRLRERGVGIQQVVDEWKTLYPDNTILVLDSETAPTQVKAKKIIEQFYTNRGVILIGTQVAIPYLYRGVDVSAIISLDAARATPTWRADKSLFRLLLKLREVSEKEVLLQTRSEPDALLEYAARGAIERFYDDEIGLRQLVKYPPFFTFILLTWTGDRETCERAQAIVDNIINTPLAQHYNNPASTKEKMMQHCLLRVPYEDQELYQELIRKASQLPPFVKVEINPDKIV